jgi:lipopolysaccharide export system protein LptA
MIGAMALLIAVAPVPALAQNTPSKMEGIALSNDKPINIESDKLEIKDKENRADFTGKVQVVQGTTTLRSDKMVVYYKSKGNGPVSATGSSDIDRILVSGNVLLNSGTQNASAEKGEFNMASQTFVLEGKQVVLTEGTNIFTGCKLTVTMDSGEAQLDSCGGRVKIQLDPKSSKSK